MVDKQQIIESIYTVIDEVNEGLPPHLRLAKSSDTVLFGQGGKLDSLGLVNLVVALEQKIGDQFGKTISITDERAMSERNSPFRSITSLAEYVARLLNEDAHE
jgi:acyl carrier protein